MSSEISTREVRLKPDAPAAGTVAAAAGGVRVQANAKDQSLQPWQFFVLAALGCATAATFMARGQGITAVILLTVLMGTAAFIGLAMLRAVTPLVSTEGDRTVMIGRRTRVAMEREKLLALRAIKELEFDRAMGKLSDEDFTEMSRRLRARATRLMRQLDAGADYRQQIEKDLDARLSAAPSAERSSATERTCGACQLINDPDARFCKGCGERL